MVNDLSVLIAPLYHFFLDVYVDMHNNIFLEDKDIPQEISLPMAVEGGKLLL